MADTCPVEVWRGESTYRPRREECGRPVKRDGMCGTHANQQDRNRAESRERQRVAELQAWADAKWPGLFYVTRDVARKKVVFISDAEKMVSRFDE